MLDFLLFWEFIVGISSLKSSLLLFCCCYCCILFELLLSDLNADFLVKNKSFVKIVVNVIVILINTIKEVYYILSLIKISSIDVILLYKVVLTSFNEA